MAPELFDLEPDKLMDDQPRVEYGTQQELELFDASMRVEMHYPILVRPHATLAGFFLIVDGHRRAQSARRLGWKKIRAMLVATGLTQAQIRQIQLRLDLQKKSFTEGERYKIIQEIKAAHPNLNVGKLAELIEIHQSTLSRYLGLDRLIPEAMDAFFAGKLGLKAAAEISQLKEDEQPALLLVRLGGGTVAEMSRERQKRQQKPDADTVKVEKIPIAMNRATVIIRAMTGAEALNLAGARQILLDAISKLDAAIKDGYSVRTARLAFEDTKHKVRKARKPRSAG